MMKDLEMVSIEEGREIVLKNIHPLEVEQVSLVDAVGAWLPKTSPAISTSRRSPMQPWMASRSKQHRSKAQQQMLL